jgi:hypothetical protein
MVTFSPETLAVFADLLGQVVLPITDPDFEKKAKDLLRARAELDAAMGPQARIEAGADPSVTRPNRAQRRANGKAPAGA